MRPFLFYSALIVGCGLGLYELYLLWVRRRNAWRDGVAR